MQSPTYGSFTTMEISKDLIGVLQAVTLEASKFQKTKEFVLSSADLLELHRNSLLTCLIIADSFPSNLINKFVH